MLINRRRKPAPLKPWKGAKPKLPMGITYLCRVHYLDLQAYLAKVYRMRDYNVLKAVGVSHGECPEYLVTGQMPMASNVTQQIDNIQQGRRTRNLNLILNLLCRDGFIIAGKYVIDTTEPRSPTVEYTSLLHRHQDPDHPACVSFRKKHRDQTFRRHASVLDRLTREFKEKETK